MIDEAHCVKKWLVFMNLNLLYSYYWGSSFGKEFSKLGDLHGFFPSHLNYMALTATASASTRKTVIRLLGMHKPVILSRSPSKSNMFYEVLEKDNEIEVQLHFLVEELHRCRIQTTKTIINYSAVHVMIVVVFTNTLKHR